MIPDRYRIRLDQFKKLISFADGTVSERVVAEPPADMATSDNIGTRRLAVDSQQTSFEENHQFRFFDELAIPKPNNHQVVYRISAVNPFILFSRLISFVSSGASYRIYPDDAGVTFTGTLGDPVTASPVNGDTTDSGLAVHPVSTITLERADGVGIFSSTTRPSTGTSCRAGTNNAQSSGSLALDSLRLGFPANFSAWIVFTVLPGGADDAVGEYELFFEERFPT